GGPAQRGRQLPRRTGVLSQDGKLDRRRPRRQPVRDPDVVRGTLRLQSSRVLRFYLEELHLLGAELSMAAHLADVSKDLRALAERSPDKSPHRSGEPYRLAVSGIFARLPATAARLEVETTRAAVGEAAPYATVAE